MAKKRQQPNINSESTSSSVGNVPWERGAEELKYFDSLKDMRVFHHAPNTTLNNIEEIDNPSLALLRDVDRFSTPSSGACYSWLLCEDITETAGGSYLHLIATVRLFRVSGIANGIISIFQRIFAARTDMTDATKYAPVEIYQRVVEEYYKECGFPVIKRGESSFLFYNEAHQGAIISWVIQVNAPLDLPAQLVLYDQMGFIAEIEKRYASRMNYTDVSQIEENPWVVILENLKSMDKKMEDALAKNNTTIYGNVKISRGDFVGGDKVTNIQNSTSIFSDVLAKVDKKENLTKSQKNKLKSEITELESAVRNSQSDEGFIKQRLQNIKKMAPDIFAVTLSTLLNPISGLGTVITKIAEKMKTEKSKS